MSADVRWMRTALALGRRGQGSVWPNPAVGCVIVKDGRLVGHGWTQPGGRPHAETEALLQAGALAQGATCYVTLEPCANWGQTDPCAKALIDSGVGRVVVGCIDPDPRVNGGGLAWLRAAGIEVVLGCLEQEALDAHLGLYRRILRGRPMVSLKLAQSLDGRIGAPSGASRWITGEAARAEGHLLRARHDAVLVGSGTALADDPSLDVRLPGLAAASPVRVVLDRRLRLSPESRLARTADRQPVWLVTHAEANREAKSALEAVGVGIIGLPDGAGMAAVLMALAQRGITRLLVEGGAAVAASLLREQLVDRLHLFTAPTVLGDDAMGWAGRLGLAEPAAAGRWRVCQRRALGQDQLVVLAPETEG